MKHFLCAIAAALFFGAPEEALAETWTVGSQEGFAPYNYTQNGRYIGIDVEILEQAADLMDVELQHFPTSWRRALLDFEAGSLDALFQLTPTTERFDQWHMVGPMRTTQTVFMTRVGSDLQDVATLDDLTGKVVGVVAGYTYGHAFDGDAEILREQSVDDFTNVRKLLLGRSDIVIGGRETLAFVVQELNAQDKVRFLPTPLTEADRYIAFPLTQKGSSMAARMQIALDFLHDQGRIAQIIQAHLSR